MTIMDGQSMAERALYAEREHGGLDREQLAQQYGWVRAVARNLVRDPWGAEDVTQETLLAALAAPPPDVPDDQRLRAWLGRVAFNLSRLDMRQSARRRAREVCVARSEAMPSVSDELESAATVSELSCAIAELSEPDRRVVRMRYFDELSTAEIAAHTGVSELAVRKRLWRARNKLRAALEPRGRERFLALLFGGAGRGTWVAGARTASAPAWNKGLAGLAAGLALCAGATWWWSQAARAGGTPVLAALESAETGRVELATHAAVSTEQAGSPLAPLTESPRPRTWIPPTPKAPPALSGEEAEARRARVSGLVLDLEGRGQPGLAVVDSAAPDEILARTDALGGFRIPAENLPLTLEARGEGLASILRARYERANSGEGLLLVAPALDLGGRVIDEGGQAIPGARVELVCDESAFARVERPVRLVSEVLCAFEADAAGRFERPNLARAAGLALRVACAGFETLKRPTLELGTDELFVLAASPASSELTGTVRRQDGRLAAGAKVRLASASTTSAGDGRFRLPLRAVQRDSLLEVSDEHTRPVRLPAFGSRLLDGRLKDGVEDVDLVLGDEHDAVHGQLIGPAPGGWLVAAYPDHDAVFDAKGNELPAAEVRSDAEGSFELELPRGIYTLYALAPDALWFARREGFDSRLPGWKLELPRRAGLESLSGLVRTSEGELLASARIDVHVQLDGRGGKRRLAWRSLESDHEGAFAFPCDPALEGELAASYSEAAGEALAIHAFSCAGALGRLEIVLARPTYVQVSEASMEAASCAVLDADGNTLAACGPLQRGNRVGLHGGWSPVIEVPPSARWLEFDRPGAESLRVPIEPRAGQVLKVRP